MPRLPDGDPAPADGALPPSALAELPGAPLGVYVHVPFCATRCGYCDFNTYTAAELPGIDRGSYAAAVADELRLARRVLGDGAPPAGTVFLGGGTPTLLAPADIALILRTVEEELGLRPGAEVTVEANPETVDPAALEALRAAGVTRLSIGMQSAVPHVLATLERTHRPGRPEAVARWAREAGFEHVSLDLIYGTPGEHDDDWRASLDAVLAAGPDHVSAYALQVEPGTRLHARVRRGELPAPDDDVLAARYEQADELLAAAGLQWYEISNWSADERARSRHNLGYWEGATWWGAGPGAHSHAGGVRWWNALHPSAWARALREGRSPAAGRELLDPATRAFERLMLGIRTAAGVPVGDLDDVVLDDLAADGLLDSEALAGGRALLTRHGRLLADTVVRALTAGPDGGHPPTSGSSPARAVPTN